MAFYYIVRYFYEWGRARRLPVRVWRVVFARRGAAWVRALALDHIPSVASFRILRKNLDIETFIFVTLN